jgi:4-hydroxy-4-methyl-2-oxoglutarate aldolase
MPRRPAAATGGRLITSHAQALLQQLAGISVCQVSDALEGLIAVETALRPLHSSFHICAIARTVVCPADDNLTLHHALHLAQPGESLVVDGSGGDAAALWGELMSISAQARGLTGTIIDGPARDPLEIAALGYPVFSRSIRPCRATKDSYGSVGETIACGNLSVENGDVVVADCNGIIAFSQQRLPEVLEKALKVVEKEEDLKVQLRAGITFFDLAGLANTIHKSNRRSKDA